MIQKRNYGIDLLRLVSMFYVVLAVCVDWVRQKVFAALRVKQAAAFAADAFDRFLDRCVGKLLP